VTIPREEPEVSQGAPSAVRPRLSIVVVLAMLLGVLLTVLLASAYYNFQRTSALQDEVRIANAALKEKSQAVEEMKTQIEALSKQMNLLKEYSVAHSAVASAKRAENAAPATIVELPKTEIEKTKKEAPAAPLPEKMKKPKPESQNCELVGKSVEDQAATLKRCVDLMDSTEGKK
jgi:dsDNA-specific endonuclease/ATPase MutS2